MAKSAHDSRLRIIPRRDTNPRRLTQCRLAAFGGNQQIAYAALLCYRPEVYLGKDDKDPQNIRGKGAAIVAKNKNGRTGEVWMQWDASCATYRQLSKRGGY